MSQRLTLVCDGCGATCHSTHYYGSPAFGPIRKLAREAGWHKTKGEYQSVGAGVLPYTRDICPSCWNRGIR